MSKNNGNLANEGKVHKKKRKQVNVYDMLFNARRKRKTRFSIENVGLAKTNSMQHSNNNSDSSSFKHIHNNNVAPRRPEEGRTKDGGADS